MLLRRNHHIPYLSHITTCPDIIPPHPVNRPARIKTNPSGLLPARRWASVKRRETKLENARKAKCHARAMARRVLEQTEGLQSQPMDKVELAQKKDCSLHLARVDPPHVKKPRRRSRFDMAILSPNPPLTVVYEEECFARPIISFPFRGSLVVSNDVFGRYPSIAPVIPVRSSSLATDAIELPNTSPQSFGAVCSPLLDRRPKRVPVRGSDDPGPLLFSLHSDDSCPFSLTSTNIPTSLSSPTGLTSQILKLDSPTDLKGDLTLLSTCIALSLLPQAPPRPPPHRDMTFHSNHASAGSPSSSSYHTPMETPLLIQADFVEGDQGSPQMFTVRRSPTPTLTFGPCT